MPGHEQNRVGLPTRSFAHPVSRRTGPMPLHGIQCMGTLIPFARGLPGPIATAVATLLTLLGLCWPGSSSMDRQHNSTARRHGSKPKIRTSARSACKPKRTHAAQSSYGWDTILLLPHAAAAGGNKHGSTFDTRPNGGGPRSFFTSSTASPTCRRGSTSHSGSTDPPSHPSTGGPGRGTMKDQHTFSFYESRTNTSKRAKPRVSHMGTTLMVHTRSIMAAASQCLATSTGPSSLGGIEEEEELQPQHVGNDRRGSKRSL